MTVAAFRRLLDSKNLSVTEAAAVSFKNVSTLFRYLNGDVPIAHGVVALIQQTAARATKKGRGRPMSEPKAKPKPKRKAKL